MGDDLNHYARTIDIETALILGGEITAVCGEVFEPELQVGTSGSAADPELAICASCELIFSLEAELARLADSVEMAR